MSERSLVIVKPDGVSRGQVGEVLRRIEAKGYTLGALELINATAEQLAAHYVDHAAKPFFPELVEYMQEGPVVALVIEGAGCIEGFRVMAGSTNPTTAPAGSIRGDLGRDPGTGRIENVVHGSDSPESAEREIGIWFPEL